MRKSRFTSAQIVRSCESSTRVHTDDLSFSNIF
jgi:hypothetical protein